MVYWLEFTVFCSVLLSAGYAAVRFAAYTKQKLVEEMNKKLVEDLARQGEAIEAKAEQMRRELGENWIMHPDCKIRWR